MVEKSIRVSPVAAVLLMLLLAGLFSVAVEAPASSTTRRAVPPSATYTVSSFNVLGAGHTGIERRHGLRCDAHAQRRGMLRGTT